MKTQNIYFIEKVTNNGITYFQIILRSNAKVLLSDVSLAKIAYRLFVNTICIPTYKDGSIVVLDANKKENAITQIINQYLVELSKKYDAIQKKIAMKGQFDYHLYMEMLRIETEMELIQIKRDSLISVNK